MEPENWHSVVTRCHWKLSLKKHWTRNCLWIAKSKHCQHLLGWLGCWIPKLVSSIDHSKNTLTAKHYNSVFAGGKEVFLSRHFDSPQEECQTDLPFYRAFLVYLLLKVLWATFTHSPTRSWQRHRGKGPHCSVKSALWYFSAQPSTHTFTHWWSSHQEQGTGVTNNIDDAPVPLGCATKPCQSVSMRNVIDYRCAQ